MRRGKSSVVLVVILIMALFCGSGCGKEEVQKEADNRLTVETVAVTQESIHKEVTYSGSLKGADEVTLYPKTAARVVAIHLQEGDPVAKGQTIISLDTTDYETQAAVAGAALAQAESAYENTRTNVERTRQLLPGRCGFRPADGAGGTGSGTGKFCSGTGPRGSAECPESSQQLSGYLSDKRGCRADPDYGGQHGESPGSGGGSQQYRERWRSR
ncbi:MAG: biotin/lipoyl-binding protein [Syntrophomonadales bacterium]